MPRFSIFGSTSMEERVRAFRVFFLRTIIICRSCTEIRGFRSKVEIKHPSKKRTPRGMRLVPKLGKGICLENKDARRRNGWSWGIRAVIMPSISKTNGLCPKFTLICSPGLFMPTVGKSFPLISRKAIPTSSVRLSGTGRARKIL